MRFPDHKSNSAAREEPRSSNFKFIKTSSFLLITASALKKILWDIYIGWCQSLREKISLNGWISRFHFASTPSLHLPSLRIQIDSLSSLTSWMMTVFRSMNLLSRTQDSGLENSLKEETTKQEKGQYLNPKISLSDLTSGSMDTSSTSLIVTISLRNGMLKTPPGKEYDLNHHFIMNYYTLSMSNWTSKVFFIKTRLLNWCLRLN